MFVPMGMSRVIRLHVYSGQFAILSPHENEEVYRIDQIKEFEHISQAYKDWLADILEKGTQFYIYFYFVQVHDSDCNEFFSYGN